MSYRTTLQNVSGIPFAHVSERPRRFSQPRWDNSSPVATNSSYNYKRLSRTTSESFLLRLMANEKMQGRHEHERDEKLAKCKEEEEHPDLTISPGVSFLGAQHHRWTSAQILDDCSGQKSLTGWSKPDLSKQNNEPRLPSLSTAASVNTNSSEGLSSSSMAHRKPDRKRSQTDYDPPYYSFDGDLKEEEDGISENSPATIPRKKPLRLPPLLLPPIYTVRPRPLKQREFLAPTPMRGPITDSEWEELLQCRYIRHAPARLTLKLSPSQSSIQG